MMRITHHLVRGLAAAAGALALAACADAGAPLAPPQETARNVAGYSVEISAPYYSDTSFTATATPSPAGSYYYEWRYTWCFNGTAPDDCNGSYTPWASEQDYTSRIIGMGPRDCWKIIEVRIRAYAGGPILATDDHMVDGACQPGIIYGGGGGGGTGGGGREPIQ